MDPAIKKKLEQGIILGQDRSQVPGSLPAAIPQSDQSTTRVEDELKLRNIRGSTAGAGSSDFHEYRHTRRAEMFRLAKMDADAEAAEKEADFQRRREEQRRKEEAIRKKKAEKRKKRKRARTKNKKKQESESESESSESGGDEQQEATNKRESDEPDSKRLKSE